MNFKFFKNTFSESLDEVDEKSLLGLIKDLALIRKRKGRVFCLGVGGSAANAGHLVNDLRKLCNIEAYSASDNVSELTARINDEGWDNSFKDWLIASKFNKRDALFIFSVGGGNKKAGVSTNLIKAIDLAKRKKAKIFGIVGRKDRYLVKN